MPAKNIVIGQKVEAAKVQRARELRRQMTPEENILWKYLRANRLEGFHFRRQQLIDGFIVDFYCHAAELVVELDGAIHAHRREYDAARDRILKARGLHVLRFQNEEVSANVKNVLSQIAEVCREKE